MLFLGIKITSCSTFLKKALLLLTLRKLSKYCCRGHHLSCPSVMTPRSWMLMVQCTSQLSLKAFPESTGTVLHLPCSQNSLRQQQHQLSPSPMPFHICCWSLKTCGLQQERSTSKDCTVHFLKVMGLIHPE